MQYGALNTLIGSYANRKDLLAATIDNFVNLSLREFENREKLEFTRSQASVVYPSNAGLGVVLDGPATLAGQAAVNDPLFRCLRGDYSVNLLAVPSLAINNLGMAAAIGTLIFPIPLHGDTWENVQRRYRWNNPPDPWQWPQVNSNLLPISVQEIVYFQRASGAAGKASGQGAANTLFLFPEVGSANIQIDYYQFIKPFNSTTDNVREDYLLQNGFQILLYGALMQIDLYYGEELKLALHSAAYEKAIDTFIKAESTRLHEDGADWSLD